MGKHNTFFLIALISMASARIECRDADKFTDTCDLELVPGADLLTLNGVSKFCGLMYAAHVYNNHYGTIKSEIHSYCDSTNDLTCCPVRDLGFFTMEDHCLQDPAGTKYCESNSQRGKPDTSGTYRSWDDYSLNVAGGKLPKSFFGCDALCGPKIVEQLDAASDSVLVTELRLEFKGNATQNIPSIYPPQTLYMGTVYDTDCFGPDNRQDEQQAYLCECRLNATAWADKPAYCSFDFRYQNCRGTWSACTAACETAAQRELTITEEKLGNGDDCPQNPGDCQNNDGECRSDGKSGNSGKTGLGVWLVLTSFLAINL